MIKPTKICTNCGKEKPRSDFQLKSGSQGEKGYVEPYCISCKPAVKRRYYEKSKAEGTHKNGQLKRTFNIDLAEYLLMLEEQNWSCAICGGREDRLLAVDHDHRCCEGPKSCGKCVRALLCSRCNVVLGFVNDDVSLLQKMIDYLGEQNAKLYSD